MKVGTDGVMLGAWADILNVTTALDIGTGSGVIALMLAQRSNAIIDAVEIDYDSANQAKENIIHSPWNKRIRILHCPFQQFYRTCNTKYDLIVSNPPYFTRSLKSPSIIKSLVRHADELPNNDLIEGVVKLLHPNGRFCGVFPYSEGNVFIAQAANSGLYCNKKLNISSRPDKPVIRMLIELSFAKIKTSDESIIIHDELGDYSHQYRELTKDFYLAF